MKLPGFADFPFGAAALVVLVTALASGAALFLVDFRSHRAATPDLVFATFTKEHAVAYRPAIVEFEKKHGVRVQLQVVDQRALQGRLQSALQVGADVPDMVELMDGTMGIFTRGPLPDVGFVDLTDRIHASGLYDKLVQSRFGRWSSRGRIFALPHDVHPTMLAYRRDLVEKLGIDVSTLTTWEEFCRVGRQITRDYTGDGVVDHYMIDLPANQPWALRLLILQRGGGMFSPDGRVTFDNPEAVDVVCWYVKQIQGSQRISFSCDWGQTLSKAMYDGLCLFYIAPDWRTFQFQMDSPGLAGKMSLMPMPAWEPGGLRTSTWGATGLAITRQCRRFDLAWELAMYLYYDPPQLGRRFADTNILPPYIPSWSQPQFDEARAFFSGVRLGRVYADLAPDVPDEVSHPYMQQAEGKLWEAFGKVSQHHARHGEQGLRDFAAGELKRCADDVRRMIARNAFLDEPAEARR